MYADVIAKLIRGENLNEDEASSVMNQLMAGDLSHAQMGAFLAALAAKGETAVELSQMARVMRARAVTVATKGPIIDTCGTGGSGKDTPNTSTMAAFVLAAEGIKVAKHGNRASTGRCGSMDVLEALHVPIMLNHDEIETLIDKCGIGFLFAPLYHPSMKNVAAVRKELSIRTVFNFLGPLANPAGATLQIVGVSDRTRAPLMAEALGHLGVERALIPCGQDGLDEITLSGPTDLWSLQNGEITQSTITPEDVGLRRAEAAEIEGADRKRNARLFIDVLGGQDNSAVRDLVAFNAAAGLYLAGVANSWQSAVERALVTLKSGRAYKCFEYYRAEAQAVAGV